jgi:hypothetical protein
MKKLYLILSILPFLYVVSFGQITIYPTKVYIDQMTKAAYLKLINTSQDPREIVITLSFFYAGYDSTGNVSKASDSIAAEKYSLLPYLKVFPKRLIIQPQKDQSVRFLVMHPPSLPDGTYIARITVNSKDVKKQVDTTAKDNKNVNIKMGMSTQIGTIIVYQKGKLSTSLDVKDMTTSLDTSKLHLIVKMEQSGNSPYWGKANISIFDSIGAIVDTASVNFALYFDSQKAFSFKKNKFKSGSKYKAQFSFVTDRPDIPDERMIKLPEIKREYEFVMPIEDKKK